MIYFIDYENVGEAVFNGGAGLTQEDKVYVFYTTATNKMTFETYEKLVLMPAMKKFVWVKVGQPNALDFQLVTFLGNQVAYYPKDEFVMVSNDKGFDAVAAFWKAQGIKVRRSESIA